MLLSAGLVAQAAAQSMEAAAPAATASNASVSRSNEQGLSNANNQHTLEDIRRQLGVTSEEIGDVEWIDYDGDGDRDLFLSVSSAARMFQNCGGQLIEVSLGLGQSFAGPQGPGTISPQGPGTNHNLALPGASCVGEIRDFSTPNDYLKASRLPTLGMLYPISSDWFIDDTTGYVGIGTTNPLFPVDVVGSVYARGGFMFPDGTHQVSRTTRGGTGPAGADGPQGLAGPIGSQGPIGDQGAQGPQGPVGLAGSPGALGSVGPTGDQGPTGTAGSDGPGLSSSQIAVLGRGAWVGRNSQHTAISTANGTYLQSGSGDLCASAPLPHGATITKVTIWGSDTDPFNDLQVELLNVRNSSTTGVLRHQITSGAPGTFSFIWDNLSIYVDSYDFQVRGNAFPASGDSWSSGLKVKAFIIEYTL